MNLLCERFPGTKYVLSLADRQKDSYRKQPADLIGQFWHEHNVAEAYRGRQILELLQNADDAGEDFEGKKRVLLRLTDSHLIAANTGHAFMPKGVRSLVVSDVSPSHRARSNNKWACSFDVDPFAGFLELRCCKREGGSGGYCARYHLMVPLEESSRPRDDEMTQVTRPSQGNAGFLKD